MLLYILKGLFNDIVNYWGCTYNGHNVEPLHHWCGLRKLFIKNSIHLVYMHNTVTVLNDFLKKGHTYLTETNLLQLDEKKWETI